MSNVRPIANLLVNNVSTLSPMTPRESRSVLEAFAATNGVALESATPREGIGQMLLFFESTEAEGCVAPDGDMLLYQWGTYDWGAGRHFELNITRQFIEADLQDDDAISQLSLTFRFAPSLSLDGLGAGNIWFEGARAATLVREQMHDHPALLAVADAQAKSVELVHSYV